MTPPHSFSAIARGLHWIMAALILAMLFLGVGMVTTTGDYHALVSIHRPIGVAILALAAIRLIWRQIRPPPPLPEDMPALLKLVARLSHIAFYGLMFAVPLAGWSMLSAGGYPVVLYGPLHLPPIMPHDAALFAVLRSAHTVLALLLFAVFLAHLGAALMHALIFKDGVFQSMAALGPSDNRRTAAELDRPGA